MTLDVEATDARLDLPHALAVRTISPVVENALRFASTRVVISARVGCRRCGGDLVEDDGPGIETVSPN